MNVEIAAARADKMKRDIWDKADQTQVFHGEIEQKATFCPNCGKPAGRAVLHQLRHQPGAQHMPAVRRGERPERQILRRVRNKLK